MGRDGIGLHRLVPDWDMPYEEPPCFWTPDGRYLVLPGFYSSLVTPWVVRLPTRLLRRSGQATRLGAPRVNDLCPVAMSPDGTRIFCVGQSGISYQIERLDARSKQLAPYLPDVHASAVDFTRDGKWLAYVEENRLWKSRGDGSEKVQLTFPPLQVDFPRWSPDAKWIAVMGREPGRPWKARVVSADGGPCRPLTSTGEDEGVATWSADGSRLAFGGLVNPATRKPGSLFIHIFDLKKHRLSTVPGSEGLWTARWSPDGRYIAAVTEDSHSLMLFDFRTRKWTKLVTVNQVFDLRWSCHGGFVYFSDIPPQGKPALFRLKVPGHQAERLVSLQQRLEAGWLGLAPDDSPLIMHQTLPEEIYALECQFPL